MTAKRALKNNDTPEDNSLRVLFLEDDFCLRFALALDPQCLTRAWASFQERWKYGIQIRQEELKEKREILKGSPTWKYYIDQVASVERELNKRLNLKWELNIYRNFESSGADVHLSISIDPIGLDSPGNRLLERCDIHLRATIGDDYPSVLRHMHNHNCNTLFITQYNGTGATEEQFIKTFEVSRIRVVFKRDVDSTVVSPETAMIGVLVHPNETEAAAIDGNINAAETSSMADRSAAN